MGACAPADVVATAAGELAGTTTSAGYGAPYNTAARAELLGPVKLQKWPGVTLRRLREGPRPRPRAHPHVTRRRARLAAWDSATADQQQAWATAYADALAKAPDGDPAKVAPRRLRPGARIAAAELRARAQSAALEGLLTSRTSFFGVDSTKALLLLADGTHLEDAARAQNLGGDQWGIMNETGNYPGQPWLWLYSLWYQVPPFSTSDNADIGVWALMILLSIGFVCIPWIPGLRTLPRHLGVHRLVWRTQRR